MSVDLTILFCYRDKEISRVKRALDSLAAQSNTAFRVLFADYGSSDPFSQQVSALCAQYPFCSYLYVDAQGKFWNRAEALNYGIYACHTPWIFTADVDLVFKPGFIDELYRQARPGEAKFFSVGYLNEQQTRSLDLSKLSALSYTKSQDFALGMVLSSKDTFRQVNGYNSFYAIWGMEDNDLKARMDELGIKTEFISKIWMLHQYHEPAGKTEGLLPEGWIAFSKDYFAAGSPVVGLDAVSLPLQRPAKQYKTDPDFVTTNLLGRKLFLRHALTQAIVSAGPKKLVIVIDKHEYAQPARSTTARFIRQLNKTLKAARVQAHARSNFSEQYISATEIRHELYFQVKSFHALLADHYIEESDHTIKLILVKI